MCKVFRQKQIRPRTLFANFSFEDEDAFIAIRPTILGIISEDALVAALEAEGINEEQAEGVADDHEAEQGEVMKAEG